MEEENFENEDFIPEQQQEEEKEIITEELARTPGAIICPKVGPDKDRDVAPGFSPRELSRNRKINVYTLGADGDNSRLIGIKKVASFTFSDIGDKKFKLAIDKVGKTEGGEDANSGLERMEKIYKEIERLDSLQNQGVTTMNGPTMKKPLKSPQVNAPEDIEISETLQSSPVRKTESFLMRIQYKDGKSTFMRLHKYCTNDKVLVVFSDKKILETGTILPATVFDCPDNQSSPEEVKIEIFDDQDKEIEKSQCLLLTYILQGPELTLIFLKQG